MGVFFRTGENSAIGVSWWFYLFVVLPLQVMWLFVKALVYVFAAAGVAVAFAAHFVWDRWNERKPPHPAG